LAVEHDLKDVAARRVILGCGHGLAADHEVGAGPDERDPHRSGGDFQRRPAHQDLEGRHSRGLPTSALAGAG
jgi:hypothetical protein